MSIKKKLDEMIDGARVEVANIKSLLEILFYGNHPITIVLAGIVPGDMEDPDGISNVLL